MFQEYGTAVTMQAKGGDAGERMYRAYGLANFAHDVLTQAQPGPLQTRVRCRTPALSPAATP